MRTKRECGGVWPVVSAAPPRSGLPALHARMVPARARGRSAKYYKGRDHA